MDKSIEQYIAEREKCYHEKEQAEHQLNRYKNMVNYIDETGRKARAHRLIQRGGAVESILPEVKELDEKTFYDSLSLFFENEENRKRFRGCIFAVESGKM